MSFFSLQPVFHSSQHLPLSDTCSRGLFAVNAVGPVEMIVSCQAGVLLPAVCCFLGFQRRSDDVRKELPVDGVSSTDNSFAHAVKLHLYLY